MEEPYGASRGEHGQVDKTGTLTVGGPELTDFVVQDIDENEALRLIASLERASEHPLAHAIVKGAEACGLSLYPVENFNSVPCAAAAESNVSCFAISNYPGGG